VLSLITAGAFFGRTILPAHHDTISASDAMLQTLGNTMCRLNKVLFSLRRTNLLRLVANAILATRADAIIATDREGIVRFWNPGAERVFGHADHAAVLG
jgi:PAS domain-containing protein